MAGTFDLGIGDLCRSTKLNARAFERRGPSADLRPGQLAVAIGTTTNKLLDFETSNRDGPGYVYVELTNGHGDLALVVIDCPARSSI